MGNYEIINLIFSILFGFFIGWTWGYFIEAGRSLRKSKRMHDFFKEQLQRLTELAQKRNNNNHESRQCENNRIQKQVMLNRTEQKL